MSLIQPFFLDTVVAIGVPNVDGSVDFTATGFLFGHAVEKDNKGHQQYWVFLVTNRHVIEGKSDLLIRFNGPMNAPPKSYPLPVGDSSEAVHWTFHPNPKVDVAVLVIDVISKQFQDVKLSYFRDDIHVASIEQLQECKFSEGDEVFVIGFPLGLAGDERNYAIVRQGIVARIRDWYEGHSNVFLIDSSIFPGNSGGPVIAKPTMFSYGKTRPYAELIGMVSGYLPYRDIAWSRQTGRPKLIAEENSGLATVVPVDLIQETISFAACRYSRKQTS